MTKAVLVSDDALTALLDERGQAEALTDLSVQHLRADDPYRAFVFADRRCRMAQPRPLDLILRSEALRRLGFDRSAAADLERAIDVDPTDPLVSARLIAVGHALAVPAARWAIADPRSGTELVEQAIRCLFAAGARVVGRIVVEAGRLTGWVAWHGQRVYELDLVTSTGRERIALRRDDEGSARADGRFAINLPVPGSFVDLHVVSEERIVAEAFVSVRVNPTDADEGPALAASRSPVAEGSPSTVTVIVPIYDDIDVTRDCLDALSLQIAEGLAIRVIMIDDAVPAPGMSALLVEMKERHGFELIVNRLNLGFIGSVNKALDQVRSGDVVLLNSDVLLPPAAISKLAAVAHGHPGIGIVNPLTNNGQFNSFPSEAGTPALEPMDRIRTIDATADHVAAGRVVRTPGGIGYCMYVTRACLDAVGRMPDVYLRGYYEDVEFCLRAQQRGFSSVCALNVYVGHKGTASFKDEKQRLVHRNERALDERFPSHDSNCRGFRRADPARGMRGALEDRIAPLDPVDVVLAGGVLYEPDLLARSEDLRRDGTAVLLLTWSLVNGTPVALLRPGGGSAVRQRVFPLEAGLPQSDLMAEIDRLGPGRIELAGGAGPLEATLLSLLDSGVTFGALLCESLGRSDVMVQDCPAVDEAEPCAACLQAFDRNWIAQGIGQSLSRSLQSTDMPAPDLIIPLDEMAQELATDLASDAFRDSTVVPFAGVKETIRNAGRERRAVLALLYPEPDLATERFIVALAGAARRWPLDWTFLLLGHALTERRLMSAGNLFVSGPVGRVEELDVLDHYGASALLAPQRWRGYGLLARRAAALGVPRAYFDWSIGAVPGQPADLSIDPRVCDAKAAAAVCEWLVDIRIGAAP